MSLSLKNQTQRGHVGLQAAQAIIVTLGKEPLNQPAAQHCQHPPKVDGESSEPERRDELLKHFYWWVCHRINQLENDQKRAGRPKASVEHSNPIDDKSRPKENYIDSNQRAQNATDDQ